MRFLLENKPYKKPDDSRDSNIENGNEAEVYAASSLLRAMGAEVSWGSRNEDGRKIDLIVSYDHPWIPKERMIFLVQVKSGSSYGEKLTNGFKLKSAAKKAVMRTSHPICLIWIDRTTQKSYWAYLHPNSIPDNQIYKDNHLITPSMRFDIARSQAKFIPNKIGGQGIIMSYNSDKPLKERRKQAQNNYKALKHQNIVCPNLGQVHLTRVGWRHMFRKTRAADNKDASILVINYLDKIISDTPTSTFVSALQTKELDNYNYRHSEYVLTYEKVKLFKEGVVSNVRVIIRLIEEIRWPKNWMSNTHLSQLIDRKVTLLSCYYKK